MNQLMHVYVLWTVSVWHVQGEDRLYCFLQWIHRWSKMYSLQLSLKYPRGSPYVCLVSTMKFNLMYLQNKTCSSIFISNIVDVGMLQYICLSLSPAMCGRNSSNLLNNPLSNVVIVVWYLLTLHQECYMNILKHGIPSFFWGFQFQNIN